MKNTIYGFVTELVCEELSDKLWVLREPLIYKGNIVDTITAPKGFVTDFASVPRVPLIFWLYGDRAHRESIIHDYLYQTHFTSKVVADKVFLEAMKVRNKPLWIRYPMYWAVKYFGGHAYETGKERFKILGNT